MNGKLKLLQYAALDLGEIQDYYAKTGAWLENEFIDDFQDACRDIVKFPGAWPEVEAGFRRKLLSRFPYALWFSVDGDDVVVARVFHTSRLPGSWRQDK